MRVSVIPETGHGLCHGCKMHGLVTAFTLCVPQGVETSAPLCAGCLRSEKEVAVDITPPPPLPVGPPGKRVKAASMRNERRVAEGIGGRTQPGSGNQPGAKGDVRKRGAYRVENKDSYSRQYILTQLVLDKIRGECGIGEKPALVLTFMEKHTMRPRERWAIIPYNDWEDHANASG